MLGVIGRQKKQIWRLLSREQNILKPSCETIEINLAAEPALASSSRIIANPLMGYCLTFNSKKYTSKAFQQLGARSYSTVSLVKDVPSLNLVKEDKIRLVYLDGKHKVVTLEEAERSARNNSADLLLVSASANPPVYKLGAADKALTEARNREKAARKRQIALRKAQTIKEIRVGAKAAEYDLDRQIKIIRGFIEKGHKVKVLIMHRRIEVQFVPEQTRKVIEKCSSFSEHIVPGANFRNASGVKAILLQPIATSENS